MSQKRVLVTDGETRAAVAVTRGLADAGFEVAAVAVAHVRPAAAHWSRSVAQRIPMPDPLTEEAGFLAALERTLRAGDFSVLLPGGDASLLSVSSGRHRLDPLVRIGLPPHENVQRSLDKTDLVLTAARHGLGSPPTVICHTSAQALEAASEIGFPVVVKPLSSIIGDMTPRRRSGSVLAADADELRRAMTTFGGSGMVQQHVRGGVVSFGGVFGGGRLLAEAVSRYHRTWYPTAGNACYSETIEAPAILRERVAALMKDLGWQGLFELELIDRGDGTWHAIDLNPRAYGSLALAIGAGANLPAIWCRHLLGSDSAPVKAVPGVFYRWTEADLRHALWQLRNRRGAAAAEVLTLHRGVVHPYLRSGDPGPGVARMLELGCKAVKRGRPSRRRAPDRSPTLIIGAGPNGLAAAAHLRDAGIDARCFGEPLASWSHQMPAGMLLRSLRRSSHIADPQQTLTIDDYEQDEDQRLSQPNLKLEEFIDYGRWFQQRAVPDVDTRKVTEVGRRDGGFGVRLDDGEELLASRVIVAAGLSPFANRPAPFAALPRSVCSHTHEHNDLGAFTGRRVAVVGSGQSALECAALLNEASATVEVLARAEAINWLGDGPGEVASPANRRRRGLPISPPPTDVGGRGAGWIAAAPDLFRKLPRALHPTISSRCIRPAGAAWLRPRLADVAISLGCRVIQAGVKGGAVELRLTDGSSREVDHVLLGTGYRIDVRRYPFLAPELVASLALADGYPVLGVGLESSVAGLHFMGAPAAHSFGPIMRFVVGTWYAAPAVARRAAQRRQPPVSFSFPRRRA
jgi:predicted ATP-grasp superfamily ATP-dependent carboligase